MTSLKILRLLTIHEGNVLLNFGLDIQSQTKVWVQKPKKSYMATRQPFWKWHCWKSIGFFPYTHAICYWNLDLIFKAKLKLRVRKLKNPIWLPGSHFGGDISENQKASPNGHKQQHAHEIWNWNSKANLSHTLKPCHLQQVVQSLRRVKLCFKQAKPSLRLFDRTSEFFFLFFRQLKPYSC